MAIISSSLSETVQLPTRYVIHGCHGCYEFVRFFFFFCVKANLVSEMNFKASEALSSHENVYRSMVNLGSKINLVMHKWLLL